MSEETTQAVVDAADTQAKPPGSEATNAQDTGDDLNALLAQFDQQTTKPPADSTTQTQQTQQTETPVPQQKFAALEQTVLQLANQKFEHDFNQMARDVRGDLDLDDDLVKAWIDNRARTDNRLQNAFAMRDAKPREFAEVKRQLGKELAKKFAKKVDQQATEDREAVAAAVRGASTKAPPDQAPNYGAMSNGELRDEYRKLGISPPF